LDVQVVGFLVLDKQAINLPEDQPGLHGDLTSLISDLVVAEVFACAQGTISHEEQLSVVGASQKNSWSGLTHVWHGETK
jgi:hypothetical protein